MKKIIYICICALLPLSVFAGPNKNYSEGRNINEYLAIEVSKILEVKKTETDPYADTKFGNLEIIKTAYFYNWDKPVFSQKDVEGFLALLEPFIGSLEKKYSIWCYSRAFMYAKHAKKYSPTMMPSLVLTFKDSETKKEKKLHLIIDLFHTRKDILAITSTVIYPYNELIEQDATVNADKSRD